MSRPSAVQAHADRVARHHARATGELRGWSCLVPACPDAGVEHVTHGDAGAEMHAHYLERHYTPAPASRR